MRSMLAILILRTDTEQLHVPGLGQAQPHPCLQTLPGTPGLLLLAVPRHRTDYAGRIASSTDRCRAPLS